MKDYRVFIVGTSGLMLVVLAARNEREARRRALARVPREVRNIWRVTSAERMSA